MRKIRFSRLPQSCEKLRDGSLLESRRQDRAGTVFGYLASRLMRKYVPKLVSVEVDVTRLFRNNPPRHSAPIS